MSQKVEHFYFYDNLGECELIFTNFHIKFRKGVQRKLVSKLRPLQICCHTPCKK